MLVSAFGFYVIDSRVCRLAEMMHNLMEISLAPSVPASLRVIPTKYNIIIRLWSHAFHKLLEALRRASFSSPLALEHLQDFIYYAYTFYTGLLEEPTLRSFRSGWLEALGDLARYRMAVAAMVTNNQLKGSALTTDAVSKAAAASKDDELVAAKSKSQMSVKSSSDRLAARIDESPSPSVGIVAARMMDVEPEKQRWRSIAKEWYAQGLADTPGTGKLHHHLGLLSREVDNEELRAVYHFVKRFDFPPLLLAVLLISLSPQHDHTPPIFHLSGVHPSHLVVKRAITALAA
jgi:hypothetical protein